MSLKVAEDTRVTLHFSLSLQDGSVVDSNFEGAPASFEYGDGQLPDGFLACLDGLSAGEEGAWLVTPEKAFGMPNPNNVQTFKRSDFASDMQLEKGLVISFADASQSELPGVVKQFDDEEVVIDFNHPLAGETLTFKVKVVAIDAINDGATQH
ncbi:peptidylprolyl isomerase [Oleiphilus sp. HI0071]|uniref:FKBP-type peptidyl-prolyl cis-trans isomerase n=1 Tax=unclassified Oleiphilus TaxID=2631174 RepID=UPI0007C2E404|nr:MULTISPECIES: FKBP-type peptidyl-prolyl cis-trans isomerase [unclassified Oleiphilus]KZY74555.1 peptidylprolyl isomerase [Oleiphilus sp. HI0065]KZY87840.1 peptidylprolyl isomerase [Oleiphilus sp. HI0071]KZY89242.1 peptidylprolyl isomerase [Oleiphilus sp. HI0073]KZZ43463.1 peptidylprolyl isomerase [Oleiphilus sp. HI0118]KZZ51259.1 peptidylprolyl isomerase [Oleiphilus sp. HI0122]KZZ81448.1 peptidylprolyl isomerase [Oleiphilus sp. HI0133]